MSATQQPETRVPKRRVSSLKQPIDELYQPQPTYRRAMTSMAKARYPVVAVIFLLLIALCAVFAQQLAPKDPNRVEIFDTLKPPLSTNRDGEMEYVLGTDSTGRDVLSRVIFG
ncbi:MAG: hypothetical protein F4Z94_10895, partial [Chloroflexi bacterium]|nr:hypothetical protein [Chloroflexota bacterium]